MSPLTPTLGRIVLFRTDARNGLVYDLPAIVTCTADTHPGDYPDGRANPLPVPRPGCVHLTVFTPGGFGTTIAEKPDHDDADFIGATTIVPGSGTYVEWDVRPACDPAQPGPRTWRWPPRQPSPVPQPGRPTMNLLESSMPSPPPCGPRRRWPFSRRA